MNKTVLAKTLLGLAALMLVGVTALAQDSKSTTITINGGRTTVSMKPSNTVEHYPTKPPATRSMTTSVPLAIRRV